MSLDSFRATSRGFLLGAIVLGPLAFGSVEPWSERILTLLLVVSALFLLFGESKLNIPPAAIFAGTVALFGVLQACLPSAAGAPARFFPFSAAPDATLREALRWGAYAAAAFATAGLVTTARHSFLYSLYLVSVLIAVVGLAQLSASGPMKLYGLRAVAPGRSPFGPYYNYNHAANLFALGALAGVALIADRVASTNERNPDFWAKTALLACPLILVLGSLAATTSRGGLLSLLVGALVLARLAPRSFLRWSMGSALLAVASYWGLLYASSSLGRFSWGSLIVSSGFRAHLYRGALDVICDFPLFGIGLGVFREVYPSYQSAAVKGIVDHVHSDYLELIMQIGFGGLLLAAGLSWVARCNRSSNRDWVSNGAVAVMVAAAAHALIDFNFHIPANAAIAFASAGFAYPGILEFKSAKFRTISGVILMVVAFAIVLPATPRPHLIAGKLLQEPSGPARRDAEARKALRVYLESSELTPDDPRVRELGADGLRRLGRLNDAAGLSGQLNK